MNEPGDNERAAPQGNAPPEAMHADDPPKPADPPAQLPPPPAAAAAAAKPAPRAPLPPPPPPARVLPPAVTGTFTRPAGVTPAAAPTLGVPAPKAPPPPPLSAGVAAKAAALPAKPVPLPGPAAISASQPSARQSLFDLDAPSTARIDASGARASETQADARASLFDLDAPTTARVDATAARRTGPVPEATAAPASTSPKPAIRSGAAARDVSVSRQSGAVPTPTSAPAPRAPLAPEYHDPLAQLFTAQGSTLHESDAEAELSPSEAATDTSTAYDENALLDEVSSLDEMSTSSRSTAELSASLVQQALQQAAAAGARGITALEQPSATMPAEYFESSFDQSLSLPGQPDALEGRRSRLASRYKAARAGLKVLGFLDTTEEERKELLTTFADYDTRLKAMSTAPPEVARKDSSVLHRELPKEGVDELDRALGRIEERLLALDEFASQDKFRARITKEKHAPKLLLRYARLLACRRFNVGYRRDRFEYLLTELLTNRIADGRLRLLARDKAGPVLLQVLTGAHQPSADGERDAAVAYLRESLERLSTIKADDEFFDSGFFLDVHGDKGTMRDQITSPEFLYLSVAINVEIHNRMEAWVTRLEGAQKTNQLAQDGKPRDQLTARLREQESAVQGVFGGFKQPKERAAQQAQLRTGATPAKEATKKDARKTTRKTQSSAAADLAEIGRAQFVKTVVLVSIIALSLFIVLYATDTVTLREPTMAPLVGAELKTLSPWLLKASVKRDEGKVVAWLNRAKWSQLTKNEQQNAANAFAMSLQRNHNIQSADVFSYKKLAFKVEFGVAHLAQ